ncbi:hypothetical protein [Terribacillus sp. 7520-G]|uniref:hypothetical protein n=1 Tax=Terribacillus TaxID=459532 RepID=UPI000BA5960A|nr:hypothetical protein [Terribacillus sp. 7520-G]PAD37414.1 hypothetical protein CHH53_16275 [Terribacillus sp. 7520-G]
MILNKGSKLSTEYFVSYLELVSNVRQCSTTEAYDIVFDRLFDRDETKLGSASYQAFEAAYERFSQKRVSL